MSMPEVAPTIVVDSALGRYVEDYDVDIEAISTSLRESGLSDKAIGNLIIRFQAGVIDENEPETVGRYLPRNLLKGRKNAVAIVSHAHEVEEIDDYENTHIGVVPDKRVARFSKSLTKLGNKIVSHEMEHHVVLAQGVRAKEGWYVWQRVGGILAADAAIIAVRDAAVGWLHAPDHVTSVVSALAAGTVTAVGSIKLQNGYDTRPEEKRCNAAEVPSGLVTVQFRKPETVEDPLPHL